jgi:dTDP-4-amino-4,6-dideoxygalactose transaminase
VRELLAAEGIETGLHYPTPCHLTTPYRRYASGSLPVVERAAEEIVSLPMFPHLSEQQVSRVCEVLDDVVRGELDEQGDVDVA